MLVTVTLIDDVGLMLLDERDIRIRRCLSDTVRLYTYAYWNSTVA